MMRIFNNIPDGRSDTLTVTQFVQGCLNDELISELLAPQPGDSTITQNTFDISTIDE